VVSPGPGNPWFRNVESWEREILKSVAQRIDTGERDELEAELLLELLRLKSRSLPRARNPKAFLRSALRNRAVDWIQEQQAEQKRTTSLDQPIDPSPDAPTLQDVLPAGGAELDSQIAFIRAWNELDPELRAMWKLLLEERGNQAAVAKRLGKHRNTVRLWLRRIQQILSRHGF